MSCLGKDIKEVKSSVREGLKQTLQNKWDTFYR